MIIVKKNILSFKNISFKCAVGKNGITNNKIITFPFNNKVEILYINDNIYDILCVIDYNQNPVIKNKGSAIFLHIARPNYAGTEGCIALKKDDLIFLLSLINENTKIDIVS